MVQIVPFQPVHVEAVMALCEIEGWPSLTEDPGQTIKALTAPGVTSMVAVE